MTRSPGNSTIGMLLEKEIRGTMVTIVLFTAALFAGYQAYSIWSTGRTAETLLVSQVVSMASQGIIANDYISLQKELSRFVDAVHDSQPYGAKIEIFLDRRPLAQAGDSYGRFFYQSFTKQERLPSNSILEVRGKIGLGNMILNALLMAIFFFSILATIYFALTRKIARAITRFTNPLSQSVAWLNELSLSFPLSGKAIKTPAKIDIHEIDSLNESVSKFSMEIKTLEKNIETMSFDKGRLEVAEQVAHDIVSPLTSLRLFINELRSLTTEQRVVLERSAQRINDIISSMRLSHVTKQRQLSNADSFENGEIKPVLLVTLVNEVVGEKRVQCLSKPNIDIDFNLNSENWNLFAMASSSELNRILSNLIDNAIESIESDGYVRVDLAADQANVMIQIRDNGCGIADEILPKVGERGLTTKKEGSGLGLYHAKKMIESWKGKLKITSQSNAGTSVEILLPKIQAPQWFPQNVTVTPESIIVVLEDDISIHDVWKSKLSDLAIQFHLFSHSSELRTWISKNRPTLSQAEFFVDYELRGEEFTGLDVIETEGLCKQSVLVSSHSTNPQVERKCELLGVGRLHKEVLPFLQIFEQSNLLTKPRQWHNEGGSQAWKSNMLT